MFYPGFILVCLLAAVSFSGNKEVAPTVYSDAVTVNGHPINYNAIPLHSKGVLAFAEGNPQSPEHKPMPFRVTLRRAGTAVQQWPAKGKEGVYSVPLEEIWPVARPGDELLVEPVGTDIKQEAYSRGKRVIQLIAVNWLLVNNC
ncbi:hypothetical protein [Spirosoma pulveris]